MFGLTSGSGTSYPAGGFTTFNAAGTPIARIAHPNTLNVFSKDKRGNESIVQTKACPFKNNVSNGPNQRAPRPNPATTRPLIIPFLDGWNHFIAAARGHAYTKPIPFPTIKEKIVINTTGE